jgi:hypothetical protein
MVGDVLPVVQRAVMDVQTRRHKRTCRSRGCSASWRVNGCWPPGFSRQHPESCLARRITTTSLCLRAGSAEACVHQMRGPIGGRAVCPYDHMGPMDPTSRVRIEGLVLRVVQTGADWRERESCPESLAPSSNASRGTHKASRTPSWEFLLFSFLLSSASSQPFQS